MEYKTKSAVIARKKVGDEKYNCIVNIFDVNDPHLSNEVPKECLEFENITKVHFKDVSVEFYLMGSDLILNDLRTLKIVEADGHLTISN